MSTIRTNIFRHMLVITLTMSVVVFIAVYLTMMANMQSGSRESAEFLATQIEEIIAENRLTCLMVTHNMQSALDLGNRTLMMDQGNIIYDVQGAVRDRLQVSDLLVLFKEAAGKNLDNDRMLLS